MVHNVARNAIQTPSRQPTTTSHRAKHVRKGATPAPAALYALYACRAFTLLPPQEVAQTVQAASSRTTLSNTHALSVTLGGPAVAAALSAPSACRGFTSLPPS